MPISKTTSLKLRFGGLAEFGGKMTPMNIVVTYTGTFVEDGTPNLNLDEEGDETPNLNVEEAGAEVPKVGLKSEEL